VDFTGIPGKPANHGAAGNVIKGMRRTILTAALLLAFAATSATVAPLREVPATAIRFVSYMNQMEKSGQKLGFWDRVTYGLALAGKKEPEGRRSF
jgi:hypothetical protein